MSNRRDMQRLIFVLLSTVFGRARAGGGPERRALRSAAAGRDDSYRIGYRFAFAIRDGGMDAGERDVRRVKKGIYYIIF